jgi:hypothetical protein
MNYRGATAQPGTGRHDNAGAGQSRALDAMRDGDVARLERLQDMAEAFCGWLHAKGAAEMEKGSDGSVETVRQLSTSFNKAARAVRLAMVLKHEVAGLRPLPNARVPGPANQNTAPAGASAPAPARHGAQRYFAARDQGDRRDDDADDALDPEVSDETLQAYLTQLLDALEADFAAAEPYFQERAKTESTAVKLTTLAAAIPHPTLDRVIADIYMGDLWDIFAPPYAQKPEALGPPRT